MEVLGAAQDSLVRDAPTAQDDGDAGEAVDEAVTARAREWAQRRGWQRLRGDDDLLNEFARAWDACESAGVEVDGAMMDAYADAIEDIARVDHASVPEDPLAAVHRVVVGIVMMRPVLAALRLLAQREIASAANDAGARDGSLGASESGA